MLMHSKTTSLSKPSLAIQHPLPLDDTNALSGPDIGAIRDSASVAYPSAAADSSDAFILSPLLALPPTFGSAYVGETFSCTLCANNELAAPAAGDGAGDGGGVRKITSVRIEAEIKTPTATIPLKLSSSSGGGGGGPNSAADEGSSSSSPDAGKATAAAAAAEGAPPADLAPGATLQRVVSHHLVQEGSHVLAVTVRYSESTASSGRVRSFKKLYQFVAKACMVVRTKTGALPDAGVAVGVAADDGDDEDGGGVGGKTSLLSGTTEKDRGSGRKERSRRRRRRRWALEAQLENSGEESICLISVGLETREGLRSTGLNWNIEGDETGDTQQQRRRRQNADDACRENPVLNPRDVQQVCFLVEQVAEIEEPVANDGAAAPAAEGGGRLVIGQLNIGWRSAMGNEGVLSTGWLSTKAV